MLIENILEMKQEITLEVLIKEAYEIKREINIKEGSHAGYTMSGNAKYAKWKNVAQRYIFKVFEGDFQIDDFKETLLNFENTRYNAIGYFQNLIGVLEGYLEINKPLIKSIDSDNAQNNNTMPSITINNSNTQSQTQSVSIFIEAIKDDLTGKQVKELKEIVSQEGDNLEKAKPKILEKVISWGGNVAAGIVTNLLTNPTIWGGL